jgi:hypothetical protein
MLNVCMHVYTTYVHSLICECMHVGRHVICIVIFIIHNFHCTFMRASDLVRGVEETYIASYHENVSPFIFITGKRTTP